MDKKLKLNVGAGNTKKLGFLSVDLYCKNADIVADCDSIGLDINTVDLIYTSHMVEHLGIDKVIKSLKHWNSLLKNNGKLVVITPNFKIYINEWLVSAKNNNYNDLNNWSLRNVVGWENKGIGMWNRTLFTVDFLRHIVEKNNFDVIHCFENETRVSNKSHIEYRSNGDIRLLAIKRNNNTDIKYIVAGEKHCKIIFDLRNDFNIRKNLVNSGEINVKKHIDYYTKYLNDDNYFIYLIVWQESIVGFYDIKIDKARKEVEIGIKIKDEFQNKGIGRNTIQEIIDRYVYLYEKYRFFLTVFDDNVAALKLYNHFNFKLSHSILIGTRKLLTMDYSIQE
jgi:predicted SAM-dependent methyltransferase/GNAT superfamily N-acetyltransferase